MIPPLSLPLAPSLELSQHLTFEEDEVRLTGTKIALWQIVRAYQAGASPEQMVLNYQGVGLAQVYAAITYYLSNPRLFATAEELVDSQTELVQQLRERLDGRYTILEQANQVRLTAV